MSVQKNWYANWYVTKWLNLEKPVKSRAFKEEYRKMELGIVISQICRKLVKGKDIETIADELEEEPVQIEEICRIAKMYAPDYDVDKIYEQLQKSYV